MAVLVVIVLAALVLVAPGLWVKRTLAKYSEPADRYRDKGSGGELARHLLDRFGLQEVGVEETDAGDHYDPEARTVRLKPEHLEGYSLTAVTIAAHEVGHALQHRNGEAFFHLRQVLAKAAMGAEKVGAALFLAAPVIAGMARAPAAGVIFIGLALGTVVLAALVHLVTLPVEFDASFGKALPILERGTYLKGNDAMHARRILKAAALTYVAGSLMGLVNVWRWVRVLRR